MVEKGKYGRAYRARRKQPTLFAAFSHSQKTRPSQQSCSHISRYDTPRAMKRCFRQHVLFTEQAASVLSALYCLQGVDLDARTSSRVRRWTKKGMSEAVGDRKSIRISDPTKQKQPSDLSKLLLRSHPAYRQEIIVLHKALLGAMACIVACIHPSRLDLLRKKAQTQDVCSSCRNTVKKIITPIHKQYATQ